MKTKLTVLMLATAFAASAITIRYTYDNAGNRTKRAVVTASPYPWLAAPQNGISTMLGDKNIRIYPNPTEGPIKIEINGLIDSDIAEAHIYTMTGVIISKKKFDCDIMEFDISAQSSGMYLLDICINGECSTWKIIRK